MSEIMEGEEKKEEYFKSEAKKSLQSLIEAAKDSSQSREIMRVKLEIHHKRLQDLSDERGGEDRTAWLNFHIAVGYTYLVRYRKGYSDALGEAMEDLITVIENELIDDDLFTKWINAHDDIVRFWRESTT